MSTDSIDVKDFFYYVLLILVSVSNIPNPHITKNIIKQGSSEEVHIFTSWKCKLE